jgi:hypothetical protein
MNYQGHIIDDMDRYVVASTKAYPTWESAQHAAEALLKRKGLADSGRYSITVETLND